LTSGALLTHVAWLRGINVGGNSTIPMAPLVHVFQELGLRNVRSYINSGNISFDAPAGSGMRLSARIESAIVHRFALRPMVVLSTAAEMRALVAELERMPAADRPIRVDVIFLGPGIDNVGIIDRLPGNPAVDDVTYVPGALIWRTPLAELGRSRMTRLVGTPTYKQMTVRGANTVMKVGAIVRLREEAAPVPTA
jgi:uncharacterized protein (DUF1697 family)